MATIQDRIPNAEVLIRLAPEELGFELLQLARDSIQNDIFHPNAIRTEDALRRSAQPYFANRNQEAESNIAIAEAWHWLELNMLIITAPDINGRNGFKILSRKATKLLNNGNFTTFRQAIAFPRDLLHPAIMDQVWLDLARGDLSGAVFVAFRTVEENVREACKFPLTDIGVPLMRKAFDKNSGPLADRNQPEAEREALAHLFCGAIGSYKNPHSHRTVVIQDAAEAQEMVMLASHLLRIVDGRRKS